MWVDMMIIVCGLMSNCLVLCVMVCFVSGL